MFNAAFGTEEIDQSRAAKALASFLRTLISADSKFDKERRGEYTFTPLEDAGFNLFLMEGGMNPNTGQPWGGADCFHCHGHAGMQMSNYLMHNNGLDEHFSNDPGRVLVTGNPLDSGKFKTPSLRNIALTAPYMHDGSVATLEEVAEHYNSGGKPNFNKSFLIRPLNLTAQEKEDLVNFMKALTDQ